MYDTYEGESGVGNREVICVREDGVEDNGREKGSQQEVSGVQGRGSKQGGWGRALDWWSWESVVTRNQQGEGGLAHGRRAALALLET